MKCRTEKQAVPTIAMPIKNRCATPYPINGPTICMLLLGNLHAIQMQLILENEEKSKLVQTD